MPIKVLESQTIILLKFRADGMPMTTRSKKTFTAFGKVNNNKKLNMKEGMETMTTDKKFNYMMLDRLKLDCRYFLGNGNKNEKNLWAGNVKDQIEEMKKLYNSFSEDEKPEWISYEDILNFEKEMNKKEDKEVKKESKLYTQVKNNLRLAIYEKPDQDGMGYKYIISNMYAYTAFRTEKGFRDFLIRSNLGMKLERSFHNEENGQVEIYNLIGEIEEISFWKLKDIPENAERFTGLSNGSLVDCYYIHTENGSQVYRPNPNAKEVYKPLPIEKHLEFIKVNG